MSHELVQYWCRLCGQPAPEGSPTVTVCACGSASWQTVPKHDCESCG